MFVSGDTGANATTGLASGDVMVLKGRGPASAADIIAGGQTEGIGYCLFTPASGLRVVKTNKGALRTEDSVVE